MITLTAGAVVTCSAVDGSLTGVNTLSQTFCPELQLADLRSGLAHHEPDKDTTVVISRRQATWPLRARWGAQPPRGRPTLLAPIKPSPPRRLHGESALRRWDEMSCAPARAGSSAARARRRGTYGDCSDRGCGRARSSEPRRHLAPR